ncbi:MAG: transglycosylase domain-containing protein, partial [Clostridia bacterium]|nr:transglycosylase domain-containing protein [Clostridia bacterium]
MKRARNSSGGMSNSRRPRTEISRSSRSTAHITKRIYKKKKHNFAGLKAVAAILLLVCIVVVLGVGAGMYAAVSKEIDAMDFDSVAYNFSSTLFADDQKGNSHEIAHLHSDGHREWLDSDQIPDIAKTAAVSIEDERFYKHKGIDLKRTFGATIGWTWAKLTKKSPAYGGSTITQQVIKNITNEKDKTATRKIKEMMRAVALEKRFTKDEILTVYLNIVYFGNQCYGIEAASKVYFSKSAVDLTAPQAAMIVGITQAPSRYNPFKHPEDALKKRNTVLNKMYKLEKITQDEYNKYIDTPLGVNSKYSSPSTSVYSYFADQVINDVVADLQAEKGYSKEFATQQILGGGLKIYTTMDYDIQAAMESVYADTSNFPGASSGTQSAMVIIDPYTGQIKGMVGGIGRKTESR